jgi:hypothetical protein
MTIRRGIGLLILAFGLPSVITGCGGFGGSQGISPATFIAPGVVENSRPAVSAASEAQLAANTVANPAHPIR